MTQQFRIDSESLRDKINTLLPSQNRGSIGVDLSGSTTIIPVVDVTETAEGSDFPASLQQALTHTNINHISVSNTTTNLVNTPGFYLILGTSNSTAGVGKVTITDGVTSKTAIDFRGSGGDSVFSFVVKLEAGDTLQVQSTSTSMIMNVTARQLADVSGNLIQP